MIAEVIVAGVLLYIALKLTGEVLERLPNDERYWWLYPLVGILLPILLIALMCSMVEVKP